MIKAMTFGFCTPRGGFLQESSRDSLRKMKERTGSTHVIFALAALQDTAHSIEVDYKGPHMVSDEELISMIHYSKELGLIPILKPLVNCRNGTWRAHISFFDQDVPCEPKWSEWFASYTNYQLHYAQIAEMTHCHMVIVGCEMVMSNHREEEWRQLIDKVRTQYGGPISYNCDKYQEDRINWWDAVDVISASGYYPMDDWDTQLDRIEGVLKQYKKAFFFAETGCMSTIASSMIPNDWGLEGDVSLSEQANFYRLMFEATAKRDWVGGYGLWDWPTALYECSQASQDHGYTVYGKPAEKVIFDNYTKK